MNQNHETCETDRVSEGSSADAGESDQPRITLSLDTEDDDPPDTCWLTERLGEAVAALEVGRIALSVVLVDDAAMIDLHRRFMDEASTTDVLTFDLRDDADAGDAAGAAGVEGEVYVCLDEARRCAAEYGHNVERELLLYAVHGLLHLLGYDDHTPDDHQRMHDKEDELLTQIGVGAVYGVRR